MIYQSTVDATESSVIICSTKKAPYGNVSVFSSPVPFFFALEISFQAFVFVLLFVDHHLR